MSMKRNPYTKELPLTDEAFALVGEFVKAGQPVPVGKIRAVDLPGPKPPEDMVAPTQKEMFT